MPLYINEDGIIKQITFDRPVQVTKKELDSSIWEKITGALWRLFSGK
jgi:hypothetical protein